MKKFTLILLPFLFASCGNSDDEETSSKLTLTGSISSSASLKLEDETSGSPTSFKVTFYKTYVAKDADCSDPILIDDYGTDGKEVDLADGESIITASVAAGTYKCLILQMNDNLKFKADKTAVDAWAGCKNTSTVHTHDVYRAPDSDYLDLDGDKIVATGSRSVPGEDKIYIFASTGEFGDIKASGSAISENQHVKLDSSLTSPGEAVYFWDATDGIKNSQDDAGDDFCVIENVTTGFR